MARSFSNDYKVILFDYVGSGASDTSAFDQNRYGTLNGYAQDVLEILAEFKQDRPFSSDIPSVP